MSIEVGKVRYNKENPEFLSIDQAHQYIDDNFNLETVTKEANAVPMKDFLNTNESIRAKKAIGYWIKKCVDHNKITDIEGDFMYLLFQGVPETQLFPIMRGCGLGIDTINDIAKAKDNIMSKIENGIADIQATCIPILGGMA